MARHLRVEYPGGFDYFTARDTDQQTIVHAETDRTDCLTRLGQNILPAALAHRATSSHVPTRATNLKPPLPSTPQRYRCMVSPHYS
jgi:hypothetical protein